MKVKNAVITTSDSSDPTHREEFARKDRQKNRDDLPVPEVADCVSTRLSIDYIWAKEQQLF